MRTSNKILLGTLLFTMLVFAFPVIWVRAKVAAGSLVTRPRTGQISSNEIIRIYEPVKKVDISNLGNVEIIPSDSLKVEIPHEKSGRFNYLVKDGALFLNTDTSSKDGAGFIAKDYTNIKLYLPAIDSVHTRNTDLRLMIGADSSHSKPAYNFNIEFSNLVIAGGDHTPPAGVIDHLTVHARASSNISFDGFLYILDGTYKIYESAFEDNARVSYDKLKIQADNNATLNMKGRNLRNAIITSTE